MAVFQAQQKGLKNFSILVSHVLVPPAMEAILSSPINRVQGFLAAGHVCTVMGYTEYEPIAKKYNVPIVVTGFEPLDILQGVYMCVKQLEDGRAEVESSTGVRAAIRQGREGRCAHALPAKGPGLLTGSPCRPEDRRAHGEQGHAGRQADVATVVFVRACA